MGCCGGIARWIIGIVCTCVIICSVVGAVLVYKKEKDESWSKLIKNNIPFIFIIVVMVCAIVSSIIGFLLCCCKKRGLYITYLIIIIIVIAIEIVAIVLAFTYKDKIIDGINDNWYNGKFNNTRISIEKKYECCGFKNLNPDIQCGFVHKDGIANLCYNKIDQEIEKNMKNLQIVAIVITIVELILLICASYLVCCNNEKMGVE